MKKILIFKVLNFTSVLLTMILLSCNSGDCTNGIQDGNETGIDCGGNCPACVNNPQNPNIPSNLPANLLKTWYQNVKVLKHGPMLSGTYSTVNIRYDNLSVTFTDEFRGPYLSDMTYLGYGQGLAEDAQGGDPYFNNSEMTYRYNATNNTIAMLFPYFIDLLTTDSLVLRYEPTTNSDHAKKRFYTNTAPIKPNIEILEWEIEMTGNAPFIFSQAGSEPSLQIKYSTYFTTNIETIPLSSGQSLSGTIAMDLDSPYNNTFPEVELRTSQFHWAGGNQGEIILRIKRNGIIIVESIRSSNPPTTSHQMDGSLTCLIQWRY